ncbi:hypothetical protein [Stigmatella aurantiaca]|uniref:Uncharacterized protein n=1 Tax=Stigmatella aurantiaca (strain DW4/3-1) TaxID=378806 RepID=Q08VE3_STIAD|nr:hypothetical protein [Stigmatella aurantiaca]ADO70874.1 uncharacterized protein STAUR_3082 [Stigmatella aurantiaca DW4/3-1]EAU64451.1 hypothetical protein STIAU_4401 [Stigmatella aurantiaca DW4/3-1]
MKTIGKTNRMMGLRQAALLTAVLGATAVMAEVPWAGGALCVDSIPVEEVFLVSKLEGGASSQGGGPTRQGTLLSQILGSDLLGGIFGGAGDGGGGGSGGGGELLGGLLGGL